MTSEAIRTDGFHFYLADSKWLLRGVTYGPFAPGTFGDSYPDEARLHMDFTQIAAAGCNTIRLYDVPNERVARCAAQHDLRLLIDIPWPKHLDVYDTPEIRQLCLQMVREGVEQISSWDNVIGVFLGNEIPADIVRWHGRRKVERLIFKMYAEVKSLAPRLLCGFANYPSTEYLELDFLDFIGFNVYLTDLSSLKGYLVRLRHLYPDKPLILSECGLDSRSNGVEEQRVQIPMYLCAGFESGLAGVLVFAWTDEWFTGGQEVGEWDFGLVDRNRDEKPALASVAETLRGVPQCRTVNTRISVVIATYNGGRTLRQCLESIEKLNYTNFETIVVDDGSTDNTSSILKDFNWVRVITQPNRGLSEARNAGIHAATGEIVAFTDSDCIVDSDWLYFIGLFLADNPGMAGVGGPNITPLEDRLIPKAVALAPGHATHVLLTHTEAEHVPGCNMAFRKSALTEIDGFDPIYRKAGDDVDVIWRLHDRGYSIGFSTAAFVWHHRRPTVSGYLKQQRGYGEAETLLLRKHPMRFNDRGQSVWRGIIYPTHSIKSYIGTKKVQYGTFGTAGYQCIYQGSPARWFYYATSFEYWGICTLLLVAGVFSPAATIAGLVGMVISIGISGVTALHNWPSSATYPKSAFPLVWALWVLHPIIRGGSRYWYQLKLLPYRKPAAVPRRNSPAHPLSVCHYWTEEPGPWRAELLEQIERDLLTRHWICSPNGLWDNWDLSVVLSPWYRVHITTVEECLGSYERVLKVRYRLVGSSFFYMALIGGLFATLLIAVHDSILARWFLTCLLVLLLWCYRASARSRSEVAEVANVTIKTAGYLRIEPLKLTGPQAGSTNTVPPVLDSLAENRGSGNV